MNRQSANGSEKSTQGFRTRLSRWLKDPLFPYPKMLCAELCAMGVKACMAERGRPEEKTAKASLGIIDITGSPIRWINVRLVGLGDNSEDFVDYGVPDSRALPPIEIQSKWVRTFPVFGRIIDVRWEVVSIIDVRWRDWRDTGIMIVQRLSSDDTIRNSIVDACEVTVRAVPESGCWLIIQRRYTWNSPLLKGHQWRCYEKIAEHLLATPILP